MDDNASNGHELDTTLAEKFAQGSRKKDSFEDFIRDFLGQFLSAATQRAYVKDLEFFFQFLNKGGLNLKHPSQIESHHFQLYRDDLIDKGYSSATINRRLVCIRSFIKWAVAKRLMDHNPLDSVKLPKVQTESPTAAFSDEEVVKMINAPVTTKLRGRTHRLILVLLFNLGLRRSELANIKIGDISKERGHWVLKIKGKGAKLRHMPLPEVSLNEIHYYLSHFTPE